MSDGLSTTGVAAAPVSPAGGIGAALSAGGAEPTVAQRRHAVRLGMWIFLATVTMLFAAFTSSYIVRQAGGDWRPTPLPPVLWFNTVLLLASSVALEIAGRDARHARWRACGASLAITGLLGIAFLIGQLGAWRDLVAAGVYLPTNPHSSFFYILTGVHAAHLVAALVVVGWLIARVRRAARGRDAEAMPYLLGVGATFWHFLGGLWLYLFGVLSLV